MLRTVRCHKGSIREADNETMCEDVKENNIADSSLESKNEEVTSDGRGSLSSEMAEIVVKSEIRIFKCA